MAMMKRFFLFGLVNLLVMGTLLALTAALGIGPYLTQQGLDYESLAAFCLVWGMGGAVISLAISRFMAKRLMGVQVIDPSTRDPGLQGLVQTVHALARGAGLPKMPEVGIYESPEVNAFATGPTRSRALVAVSTGLLNRMGREEVEGVLGHEIAHVANGDMVTMTLVQGVVNAFVMFLARIIAFAIANLGRRNDDSSAGFSAMSYHITVYLLEMVLMIFGTMVVAWFSRHREFRADAGGARLAGRDKMISALEGLRRTVQIQDPHVDQPGIQAFKISSRPKSFLRFFATHPPLEERIARLETMTSS